MSRLNVGRSAPAVHTHGGVPAYAHLKPIQQLRRSVLACLLWEDTFYESGQSIADRISAEADKVEAQDLAKLAIEARTVFNLRHVSLWLLKALAKRGGSRLVGDTIYQTIQRADELAELLAMMYPGGDKRLAKGKLPKQVKLGLARAFRKFDEYALAKYNRDAAVTLRDVLFICHAKPKDEAQSELWKRLIDDKLATPDTWETELSAGKDKKATFERLLREGKLGYLALLRNLRNMADAGCDMALVRDSILARKGAQRVLPFRYVAAARACPQLEPAIDEALSEAVSEMAPLPGKTLVLVDVSSSMHASLSGKSDLNRIDAAAALACIIHGDLRVFSFSDHLVEVPPRRGIAGVDAIKNSQPNNGTALAKAVKQAQQYPHDRIIVITDEQATDSRLIDPVAARAYMINVASYEHGVGYGKWTHLDGFSEGVLRYMHAIEAADGQ